MNLWCFVFIVLLNSANSLFFQIINDKERCFIDDFLSNTIILIKYSIFFESNIQKGKIAS